MSYIGNLAYYASIILDNAFHNMPIMPNIMLALPAQLSPAGLR